MRPNSGNISHIAIPYLSNNGRKFKVMGWDNLCLSTFEPAVWHKHPLPCTLWVRMLLQEILSAAFLFLHTLINTSISCRSQWPCGLMRSSAAARLLRSWVWIPPGAWMFVCCECCVLSGRGLCDELITRPEESYWLWCVFMCDLETSRMRRSWPALGRSATGGKISYLKIEFHPPRMSKPQ